MSTVHTSVVLFEFRLGDSVCDLDSPGTVGVRKNNLLSSTSLYIN